MSSRLIRASGWRVRPATHSDVEAIRAVASSAWRDTYDGLLDAATIEAFIERAYSVESVERRIQGSSWSPRTTSYVVAFANAVADADHLNLAAIYALPERRGQGAGTDLLEALRSRFPRLPIAADVLIGNRKGEVFYERRGFTPRETSRPSCSASPSWSAAGGCRLAWLPIPTTSPGEGCDGAGLGRPERQEGSRERASVVVRLHERAVPRAPPGRARRWRPPGRRPPRR